MNVNAKTIFDLFVKQSDCGANAKGGHGFQPGNTCASDDNSPKGQSLIKPREVPNADAKLRTEWRKTRAEIEDLTSSGDPDKLAELAAKEKTLRKKMADAGHEAFFDASKADAIFENNVKFLYRFDKAWNKREEIDPERIADDALSMAIDQGKHGLDSEEQFPKTRDKITDKMLDVVGKHGLPVSDYDTIRSLYEANNTADFTVKRFAEILSGETGALFNHENLQDKKQQIEKSDGGQWKIVTPSGHESIVDDEAIRRDANKVVPKALVGTFARLTWQPNVEPAYLAMITYANVGDESALKWQAANGGSLDGLADSIADAVGHNAVSDAPKMSEQSLQVYRDALKEKLRTLDAFHPQKMDEGSTSAHTTAKLDEINEMIALEARIKHAASSIDRATKQPVSEVVRGLSDQFYKEITEGIENTDEFKAWATAAHNEFMQDAQLQEQSVHRAHNIPEGKVAVTSKTAGQIKQHVVDSVVGHLKSTDEQITAAAQKIWSHKEGMTREDVIQEFVDTWAVSSSDHNQYALLMQEAVKQRFGDTYGMDRVYGGDFQLQWAQEKLQDPEVAHVMEDIVDAMYENTQKQLKEDSYLLFRGARFREHRMPPEVEAAFRGNHESNYYEWNNNDGTGPIRMLDRNVECNPLSSFSTDYETASMFSGGIGGGDGKIMSVIGAVVPKNRVFATFLTGVGCTNEAEFVVLGGDPYAARMTLGGAPPYSRSGFIRKAKEAQEKAFADENES